MSVPTGHELIRYMRSLDCWLSRPDYKEEVENDLKRERLWLGLDCDVSVVDPVKGRREFKDPFSWRNART